jgi:hypothetical protein
MLPYILAAIGGYLIGDSQPTSFADGGQTEESYRWITYRTANTDEGFRNFYSSQGNLFGSLDTVIKYIQDNWDYSADIAVVSDYDSGITVAQILGDGTVYKDIKDFKRIR